MAALEPELIIAIPINIPYSFIFSQDIARNQFINQFGEAELVALFGSTDGVKPVQFHYGLFTGSGLPPGLAIASNGVLNGTPTAVGFYLLILDLVTAPSLNPPPPGLTVTANIARINVQATVSGNRSYPIF